MPNTIPLSVLMLTNVIQHAAMLAIKEKVLFRNVKYEKEGTQVSFEVVGSDSFVIIPFIRILIDTKYHAMQNVEMQSSFLTNGITLNFISNAEQS